VVAGSLAEPDEVERQSLTRARSDIRLACRARLVGDVEVRLLFAPEPATQAVAPERQPGRELVAGVDLGTTSVAVAVLDARSGRELGRASVPNRQAAHGADVLSRLTAAQSGAAEELQRLGAQSIAEALDLALVGAGGERGALTRVVIAGNTAMVALFEAADVTGLAVHPFAPPVLGGPVASSARELMDLSAAEVTYVPVIASFVGGDALAATVSGGLIDREQPSLLVDIGTNAEIVLALADRLLVASTAAGPAFEGAGISCGGPAGAGAVERVAIVGSEVELATIGDAEPGWLSGAGVLSAIRALRDVGHLAPDGRMQVQGPLGGRFSADDAGVLGVDLSPAADHSLVLTQLDVRAIQLAKAAVRVGIQSLLASAGIHAADLEEVLVAGAFGAALEPDDLVALGVLPSAAKPRARRIGNASLSGAAAMALDPALVLLAQEASRSAVHIDLATAEQFGSAFIEATQLEPFEA
jgi:uncharacterized 2Fe-2S/4Fe-4S cluster protein (DUF4445 family)